MMRSFCSFLVRRMGIGDGVDMVELVRLAGESEMLNCEIGYGSLAMRKDSSFASILSLQTLTHSNSLSMSIGEVVRGGE